jgi:hypothetical protein
MPNKSVKILGCSGNYSKDINKEGQGELVHNKFGGTEAGRCADSYYVAQEEEYKGLSEQLKNRKRPYLDRRLEHGSGHCVGFALVVYRSKVVAQTKGVASWIPTLQACLHDFYSPVWLTQPCQQGAII